MRVAVIGVGTRRGDDAAGLAVAEALAARALPAGVCVRCCERPVPDLLDALDGIEGAVLVDAARTGAPPGRVVRLDPSALARGSGRSSHGLGVAQALALAEGLGRAPKHLAVIAIEASPEPAEGLSAPVRAALPEAAAAALSIASEIAGLYPET